ncbi:MAG: RsmB/NOP family class I SAM-dependent RNA methyltransferase [Bacteroidia bacterium]
MKEKNQFYQVTEAIRNYNGDKPLSFFLNAWFRQHRNMGSHDRKTMRTFVYNYFRLGKCLSDLSIEERIAIATFTISNKRDSLVDYCITNLTSLPSENIFLSLDEKIKIISQCYPGFDFKNIFSFQNYLSDHISAEEFYKSFLIQPDVWIRVRENFKETVLDELKKNNIEFTQAPDLPNAFGISNSTQLENLKTFEKGYFEIQDRSSQKTGAFFQPNENEHWWDCCAGSGGKSLLLSEQEKNIKITVSDTRDAILENLKKRFHKAGLNNFEIKNLDLTSANSRLPAADSFDGIIADFPCSGSGTWARTPEMLLYFNESDIEKFVGIQKEILKNITPFLKKGKPLIYITCSVFKNENENIVDYAVNNLGFRLEKMELVTGYDKKADTLFTARLIRI